MMAVDASEPGIANGFRARRFPAQSAVVAAELRNGDEGVGHHFDPESRE
jgi:hypothetical protein